MKHKKHKKIIPLVISLSLMVLVISSISVFSKNARVKEKKESLQQQQIGFTVSVPADSEVIKDDIKDNNSNTDEISIDQSESNLENQETKQSDISNESMTDISDSGQNGSNYVESSSEKSDNQTSSNVNNNATVDGNAINTSHWDYPTHKGRIDCYSSDDCNNKMLPIYFDNINSITNIFYISVMSNDNDELGYFAEFVFHDYDYADLNTCNQAGTKIKNALSDRVTGFDCIVNNDKYTLKIYTDY